MLIYFNHWQLNWSLSSHSWSVTIGGPPGVHCMFIVFLPRNRTYQSTLLTRKKQLSYFIFNSATRFAIFNVNNWCLHLTWISQEQRRLNNKYYPQAYIFNPSTMLRWDWYSNLDRQAPKLNSFARRNCYQFFWSNNSHVLMILTLKNSDVHENNSTFLEVQVVYSRIVLSKLYWLNILKLFIKHLCNHNWFMSFSTSAFYLPGEQCCSPFINLFCFGLDLLQLQCISRKRNTAFKSRNV